MKVLDEELNALAVIYNENGRQALYEHLEEKYNISNPFFVLKRMKSKDWLNYDKEQDLFLLDSGLDNAEELFMSMDELCSPMRLKHVNEPARMISSKSEAMEQLIQELLGDRLLELDKYIKIDSVSKTIFIDKTSLANDGYHISFC